MSSQFWHFYPQKYLNPKPVTQIKRCAFTRSSQHFWKFVQGFHLVLLKRPGIFPWIPWNHRIVSVLENMKSSSPANSGSPKAGDTGMGPGGFWIVSIWKGSSQIFEWGHKIRCNLESRCPGMCVEAACILHRAKSSLEFFPLCIRSW